MKYTFKELINVPKLQELTDELYIAASIPSAIIAMDGEILTGSGWQKICTDFHRKHPQIEKECIKSDTNIRTTLADGEPFAIYKCPRGLVDASSPVIIDGEHVANVFSGQVFLEPLDETTKQFFREQARKFGFDETEYIKAFKEVPIFTEKKFRAGISFLAKLAQLIADMGLTRLRELEAMETLRESEEKYRLIAENATDVIWVLDPENQTFTYASPSVYHLLGFTDKESINRSLAQTVTPASLEYIQKTTPMRIERMLQGDSSYYTDEIEVVHKDGHIIPTEINMHFVKNKFTGLIEGTGVMRDITERKRAEEALRNSEALKNTIIESSPDCIKLLDLEGKLTYMSKGGRERLEIKDIRVYLNKNWTDFWQGKDNINARMAVDTAVKGAIGNFQGYSPTETGIPRWWDVVIAPIRNNNGEVERLLAVSRDITEQKKMGDYLQQSQKMEAVGTLAGGIAHDFNNILAIILGNAELASDDVPEWNPASKSLKEIRKASIRAKDMVRQLLAFSRKTDEVSKPIDMAPIIRESMKMLRSAIPTSIEFKQHISDEQCSIMGDATQINQIVMNLVTNAADVMSEKGGLLEVTLEDILLQEEKACFHWVLPPGHYFRLRMRDTGEGIDPTIMDRIFEPYFTTKEVGKGTGMGLSVVHGIVKRHGGGIRIESALGKGTLFEIYFSALEKAAVEEKETEGEITKGFERILFVDDEESLVSLNQQRLERLGYNVKSTTKPVEALEWFTADPDQFDVIITDMTMPRMTGDRLAAEVLKIRPHMPIIICTGYSERMSEKKAEALGVRKYIEKPIDLRNLASSIREVLDKK